MNAPKLNPRDSLNSPDSLADLDQQINRTLTALGQKQPESDFQDRLLHALDRHQRLTTQGVLSTTAPAKTVTSTGAQRRGETAVFRRWRYLAFASAALATVLAVLVLLPPKSKQYQQWEARKTAVATPTPSAPVLASTPGALTSPTASPSVMVGPPTPSVATSAHPTTSQSPPTIPLELSTTAPLNLDQQALADLQAPSQPAPPLPPTSQERLVRLMLRRGEKRDLAQLNAGEQALYAEQEQSAFKTFFDPPLDPRVRAQLDETASPSTVTPQTSPATPQSKE